MRIGVDATCWSNRRGYGRFARSLLGAVLDVDRTNEYVFFVDDDAREFPLPDAVQVVRVAAAVPTVKAAAANGRRSLKDLWAMSRAISAQPLDLLFFPSVYSFVPVAHAAPKLVTIHDVIPELFPELVFPTRRSRLFWRAKMKLACAQSDLVLTVSDYSRRRLCEQLKIPIGRLRVVNEASDPAFHRVDGIENAALFTRLGFSPGTPYVAFVGGFSPHKNLHMLVDVFRELVLDPRFAGLRLVLAGDYEGDVFYSCFRQLVEQVREAGLQGRVLFPGYLSDPELLVLLNHAQVLALPSFCEGFGLPAVEAAACGTPAVVTTESPLGELLKEGAISVSPHDRAGWRAALVRILADPELRSRMGQSALTAAGKLSWKNSAQQLLSIFDEVRTRRVATA